jgi:hypothetical protein
MADAFVKLYEDEIASGFTAVNSLVQSTVIEFCFCFVGIRDTYQSLIVGDLKLAETRLAEVEENVRLL